MQIVRRFVQVVRPPWTAAAFAAFLSLALGTGCSEDETTAPSNRAPQACFTYAPTSDTTRTEFALNPACSSDPEDPRSSLEALWDWEADGAWDTDWMPAETAVHRYPSFAAVQRARLAVRDTGGLADTVEAVLDARPKACLDPLQAHWIGDELDYEFDAGCSEDALDAPESLQVRWDWGADGAWDTAWSHEKRASHRFPADVDPAVAVQVRDTAGQIDSTADLYLPVPPHLGLEPPSNLLAVNGDGWILLRWDSSPSEGHSSFQGYNVYRHTSSLIHLRPQQREPHRLNASEPVTVGPLPEYRDEPAPNGEKLFYCIVAVEGDSSRQSFSDALEIDTAARAELESELVAEFAVPAGASGLRLADGHALAMSGAGPLPGLFPGLPQSDNRDQIDVYLGTTDPGDAPGFPLALKSPELVMDGDPGWAGRSARLKLLGGSGEWDRSDPGPAGWASSLELGDVGSAIGKVVAIYTPPRQDTGLRYFAKVMILEASGDPGARQIRLRIAYQSRADYPRFRK